MDAVEYITAMSVYHGVSLIEARRAHLKTKLLVTLSEIRYSYVLDGQLSDLSRHDFQN